MFFSISLNYQGENKITFWRLNCGSQSRSQSFWGEFSQLRGNFGTCYKEVDKASRGLEKHCLSLPPLECANITLKRRRGQVAEALADMRERLWVSGTVTQGVCRESWGVALKSACLFVRDSDTHIRTDLFGERDSTSHYLDKDHKFFFLLCRYVYFCDECTEVLSLFAVNIKKKMRLEMRKECLNSMLTYFFSKRWRYMQGQIRLSGTQFGGPQ